MCGISDGVTDGASYSGQCGVGVGEDREFVRVLGLGYYNGEFYLQRVLSGV